MDFLLKGNTLEDFLNEKENESFHRLNEKTKFRVKTHFVGIVRNFKEDRSMFLFLEHLERQLMGKRTQLYVSRAIILSLIAISISVVFSVLEIGLQHKIPFINQLQKHS